MKNPHVVIYDNTITFTGTMIRNAWPFAYEVEFDMMQTPVRQ